MCRFEVCASHIASHLLTALDAHCTLTHTQTIKRQSAIAHCSSSTYLGCGEYAQACIGMRFALVQLKLTLMHIALN